MVGLGRLERPTSPLSGVRSNHLSYRPEAIRAQAPIGATPDHALSGNGEEKRRRRVPPVKAVTGLLVFLKRSDRLPGGRPQGIILRKEVIQPQVPLRLPCYDFTPVADPTVVACLLAVGTAPSGKTNSHGVTGGVYKARERIHRGVLIHDY
jgi:hypothetical protein